MICISRYKWFALFIYKRTKKVVTNDMKSVRKKIGVPGKRELFGERRNDGISELMTFI